MSDLIDRQALLKQIDIDSDGEPGYYGDTWKFIDTIKNMPNVHDLPKDTDTISRKGAIDALRKMQTYKLFSGDDMLLIDQAGAQTELMLLPPAQPSAGDCWGCNCPKMERLAQPAPSQVAKDIARIVGNENDMRVIAQGRIRGRWIPVGGSLYQCDQCGVVSLKRKFCSECGADMRGEQDE